MFGSIHRSKKQSVLVANTKLFLCHSYWQVPQEERVDVYFNHSMILKDSSFLLMLVADYQKNFHCLQADSVVIRRIVPNLLTTGYFANSAPGNIIVEEWPMISRSTISKQSKQKILPITRHRIFFRCGAEIKSISAATVTGL